MGAAQTPQPVKLIIGLLGTSEALLSATTAALCERFGSVDAASAPTPWTFSSYYQAEMGDTVLRQFISFDRLIAPGKLAGVKQLTNEIEERWRGPRGRQVNVDPGYIAALKLVLATTKDAGHRVYLSGGMYGEVTLEFRDGTFIAAAHTYPYYAAGPAVTFFNGVRSTYLLQLRQVSTDTPYAS